MKDFLKRISSRKFIAAVVAGLVVFANHFFGWNLDIAEVQAIVGSLLVYVIAEGTKDVVTEVKK